jgi:alkylation response protein AidB-like acyl-CoA dehydrogenase
MDFSLPPEIAALRAEARRFLAEHLTPDVVADLHRTGVSHDDAFARAMGARGWIDPAHRNPELGDAELPDPILADHWARHVISDELTRAESPTYAVDTTRMVVNVIQRVGNVPLSERVVAATRRGEVTIALGMTEPEAGSDVAAVRTRARGDGDGWIVDGQKMFTTNGHVTDYVFLLARTNPDVPNHRGLTTFLVPTDHPGVEAQAVRTVSGERTNIMFFADVHLDDEWRIGEVDRGWDALMLSLQDEHSASFSPHLARLLGEVEAWAGAGEAGEAGEALPLPIGDGDVDAAPAAGAGPSADRPLDDPEVAERLCRAATDLEVARLLEERVTWMDSIGEVPVTEGPMAKLFSTEAIVRHAEQLTELVGPDALRRGPDPTALRAGRIEHALRFSLGTTIYAGTSEIQRNIIAQRRCGLPR